MFDRIMVPPIMSACGRVSLSHETGTVPLVRARDRDLFL
jgi:hypothetical protein